MTTYGEAPIEKPSFTNRLLQKSAPYLQLWSQCTYSPPRLKPATKLVEDAARFLANKQDGSESCHYRFADGNQNVHLFGTVCAYLIKGLCNIPISILERDRLIKYILESQREDGLFFDNKLLTGDSEKLDHFGPRHLTLMVVPLFEYFDFEPARPLYRFNGRHGQPYLDAPDLAAPVCFANPVMTSNYFMNVTGLLQYARDYQASAEASHAVEELKKAALSEIYDVDTGLFWRGGLETAEKRENAIRSDYHYRTIFAYDKELPRERELEMGAMVCDQQNLMGGFGIDTMPDACADMDSIYLLVSISEEPSKFRDTLTRACHWLHLNQRHSGGFQFMKFWIQRFGGIPICEEAPLSASMKGTWFRLLAIALAYRSMEIEQDFRFCAMPGYHVWPRQ